jgi:hypothetical protein
MTFMRGGDSIAPEQNSKSVAAAFFHASITIISGACCEFRG